MNQNVMTYEVEKLDEEVERLESFSGKESICIFGLPEYETSTAKLKSNMLENIIHVTTPEDYVSSKDILHAFRMGKM